MQTIGPSMFRLELWFANMTTWAGAFRILEPVHVQNRENNYTASRVRQTTFPQATDPQADAGFRDTHAVQPLRLLRHVQSQPSNTWHLQFVEKEINCCDPTIPRNDKVSPGISWSLTWTARYPSDTPPSPNSSGSAIG